MLTSMFAEFAYITTRQLCWCTEHRAKRRQWMDAKL